MCVLDWTIVGIATTLLSTASQARTCHPNYPVCIHAYAIGGSHIDCSYTSLTECPCLSVGPRGGMFHQPIFHVCR